MLTRLSLPARLHYCLLELALWRRDRQRQIDRSPRQRELDRIVSWYLSVEVDSFRTLRASWRLGDRRFGWPSRPYLLGAAAPYLARR